ncbi:hypothetical protein Tco_0625453 [Tanacetum coccineum]|uniref:Uncharacterized protein n=1 Tax=Tanacetum coccineum TaxID=301880 RepID=A0ABQ4WGV6_9ASTR
MEMEHYLEYIDNEVWKVIQNGNSKKRISIGKDGVVRVLSSVTAAEIQAVEKERKGLKNILNKKFLLVLLDELYKKTGRMRFRVDEKTPVGFDKRSLSASLSPYWSTLLGNVQQRDTCGKEEERFLYQLKKWEVREESDGFAEMDDGLSIGEKHTKAEKKNHALYVLSGKQ